MAEVGTELIAHLLRQIESPLEVLEARPVPAPAPGLPTVVETRRHCRHVFDVFGDLGRLIRGSQGLREAPKVGKAYGKQVDAPVCSASGPTGGTQLDRLEAATPELCRHVPASRRGDIYHWRHHIRLVRDDAAVRLARAEAREPARR